MNCFKENMLNNEIITCLKLLNLREPNSKIYINEDTINFIEGNL